MNTMINAFFDGGNQSLSVIFLSLASFRVYLEIIGFDFSRLPLTRVISSSGSKDSMNKFHRTGLIFSVGYIILTAPSILLS